MNQQIERRGGNRFWPIQWLTGGFVIFVLLYSTSHVALLYLPRYEGIDMKSQLAADYSVWDTLVFQPIDPSILEEIKQERDLPEQLILDAPGWTPPAVVSPSPSWTGEADHPATPPTLEASPGNPSVSTPSNTSTPVPTISVTDPQTTEPTQTTQPSRPTKTRKPQKTPKPPKTEKTPRP